MTFFSAKVQSALESESGHVFYNHLHTMNDNEAGIVFEEVQYTIAVQGPCIATNCHGASCTPL